jgi:pimeloyl-ACP methyl ester carboxylesterase
MNPGGPGASGIQLVETQAQQPLAVYERLRETFDIVRWDPRGVGPPTSSDSLAGERYFDFDWSESNFLTRVQ